MVNETELFSGGDTGVLMRTVDWSRTPLGPVSGWSHALRATVGLLLRNRFPLLLWWGPQFVQIYNDAYAPIPGDKHPEAIGQPARECWNEIWHIIGPMIEAPFSGQPATWNDDLILYITRRGFLEETHFKVAYSPVPDDSVPSGIGGVLGTVAETTQQVFAERQLRMLRELGVRTARASSPDEAGRSAVAVFKENGSDVSFALLYLLEPDGKVARLAASSEFTDESDPFHPEVIDLEAPETARSRAILQIMQSETVVGLGLNDIESWASSSWINRHGVRSAVGLRIASPDQPKPYGFLIAGCNPHRDLDDGYRTFFELAATQIGTAIRNAKAFEEQKFRAEQLAELDRAKTDFFANVSHEFRTPLTLLLGPLEEEIEDRASAAESLGRLETIHRNGLRLLRLVNTLLDFSRIEAGRTEAVFEPVDLAHLAAELTSSFRYAVEKAGLELDLDCPSLPELVYVDREHFEKIVLNLVSNAFKFTFEGRIRVAVAPTANRRSVRITVTDTGVGIPASELPRLFERFHQVPTTRSRTHEGTGIGLALVQELVKAHGGTVAAESELGKGTTFTVTLPFGSDHLPPGQIGRRTATSNVLADAFVSEALCWLPAGDGASAGEPPSAVRVLLADDNQDMREYITRLLRKRWQVTAVPDGRAALEEARRQAPDLILSDVMMPEMDGVELLARVRQEPRLKTVPVILISARAGEESTVAGLDAGADDYLVKPFSSKELIARVAAHLELARVRRESEEAVRESQKRVQEAQRVASVGKLAGGVAHTFNNLLTTITGFTALALENPGLPADVQDQLTEVQEAAQSAAVLTRQLLAYGQKQMLRPVPLSIDALLASIEPDLRELLGQGIALELGVGPHLPQVLADPAQIQLVMRHLLANARDAMPGGGNVTIRAETVQLSEPLPVDASVVPPGRHLKLVVSDTGRGISSENKARIFEPFFTTKEFGQGEGLGLSVVMGVIRQSGGHLRVQSEPNRGTTFDVFLPVAEVPRTPAPMRTAPARVSSRVPTILVAEDEPSVRKFVATLLKKRGYRVVEACDGAEALELAADLDVVDLLISDVLMPRLDGPALARRLVEREPRMKVLFISGYSGEDAIREGFIEKGARFMQKPFESATFLTQVSNLLERTGT